MSYKEAVLIDKRHHVRNGAYSNKVRIAAQNPVSISLTGAGQLEGDPDAGQIREGIRVFRLLAVDHGTGCGENAILAFVMVCNDDINPERRGIVCLFQRGDAAIHRNDESNAFFLQLFNRIAVQTVTLVAAVRDICFAGDPFGAQIVRQQAGGGNTVYIIISEDCGLFTGFYRPADTLRSFRHILHEQRIM